MRAFLRHSKWFWVRIAVVGAGALSGVSVVSPEAEASSNVAWMDCAVIFLFAVLGLLPVVGVQTINPHSARIWRRPSWEINPFLFREPLQFFHCAAFHFLAMGIVAGIILMSNKAAISPLPVALLGVGAGIWLGVRLSMRIFRHKMADS